MMAGIERRLDRRPALRGRPTDSMHSSTKKFLIAAVTVICVATQIVWAAALSYPLALVVIGITHSLAQL